VTSLKKPIARSLGEAKKLRRKVTDPQVLEELIAQLTSIQKSASIGCGKTYARSFTLAPAQTASSRRGARKR
jgi:hypothetical protein